MTVRALRPVDVDTLLDQVDVSDVDKAGHTLARSLASVTVARAARIAALSEATIRRAIDTGELAHQRYGDRISVRLVDLAAYMDRRRHGPPAD